MTKTLPLPCVSTAFVTKILRLPCVSIAFVTKTLPFLCGPQVLMIEVEALMKLDKLVRMGLTTSDCGRTE